MNESGRRARFSELLSEAHEPLIVLRAIVRLRWLAVVGQVAATAVAVWGFHLALPVTGIAGVILATGLSNAVLAAGIAVSFRFRLDSRTHGVLMAEIEHLKAGARTPTSPEAREIVEDLSGRSYERLWGRG